MHTIIDFIDRLSDKKFILFSLLFYIIISSTIRLPVFFFDFFSNDEAAHFIGSIIIKKGFTLYEDFVDNKPPFIYLFYLLSQMIFGEDIKSIHIATTLILIPLIALFISFSFSNKNRLTKILSGIFFIFLTSTYIPTDMLATNCEIVMLFFASIAFIFLKSDTLLGSLLFGLFISLSTLSKQQAAILLFVPILNYLFNKDRLQKIRHLIMIFLGFLIPIGVTIIYFYNINNFTNFVYFTIGHNIGYSKNPIEFLDIIYRILKYLLPYILIISPFIYLYIKSRKYIDRSILHIYEPTLALSFIIVFIGFRFFPHYFIQFVFPLSILSASYFTDINVRTKALKLILMYMLIMSISFNIYTFLAYSKKSNFIEETEPLLKKIPESFKDANFCKNQSEYIFVWGYAPLFYYYFYKECGMLPASRFILPQASIAGYIPGNESQFKDGFNYKKYIITKHRIQLIEDLKRNKPYIIIDTSRNNFHNWKRYPLNSFADLYDFVNKNYFLAKDLEGFEIYIRR